MVAMMCHTSPIPRSTTTGILPIPSTVPMPSPTGYHMTSHSPTSSSQSSRGSFSGNHSFPQGGSYHAPRPSVHGFFHNGVVPECQICHNCGHTAVNCYQRHSSP